MSGFEQQSEEQKIEFPTLGRGGKESSVVKGRRDRRSVYKEKRGEESSVERGGVI